MTIQEIEMLDSDNIIHHISKGLVVVNEEGMDKIRRHPSNYSPALFSEGTLERLGFKDRDTNYDGGDHFYVLIIDEMEFSSFRPFDTVELGDISIGAVHGLQNIISASLSKRLTFKK